jgi:hypothetical protein
MDNNIGRNTLLEIPLIEERYVRFFFLSIIFHGFLIFLVLFSGYLFQDKVHILGPNGPMGGGPGDIPAVGIADRKTVEGFGGLGMFKPSPVPQPTVRERPNGENKDFVPIPSKLATKETKSKVTPPPNETSQIPVDSAPGKGGVPQPKSGSGGGSGGGVGPAIGEGSGGGGNSLYERALYERLNQNWVRPAVDHVEIVYSFYISANGTLYNIKKEKSSGNAAWDLTVEIVLESFNRNPLPPPPPELSRTKFVAPFKY